MAIDVVISEAKNKFILYAVVRIVFARLCFLIGKHENIRRNDILLIFYLLANIFFTLRMRFKMDFEIFLSIFVRF